MQMVMKFLLFIVIAWIAILFFMPKQELYYKLEHIMKTQDIVINENSIKENISSLKLESPNVFAKGIPVGKSEEIEFFTLLFYSKLSIDGVQLDDFLKDMLPISVDKMELTHSILKPTIVDINLDGSFGLAKGKIDLIARQMRVDFLNIGETKDTKALESKLNKDEKGWFYETSF